MNETKLYDSVLCHRAGNAGYVTHTTGVVGQQPQGRLLPD